MPKAPLFTKQSSLFYAQSVGNISFYVRSVGPGRADFGLCPHCCTTQGHSLGVPSVESGCPSCQTLTLNQPIRSSQPLVIALICFCLVHSSSVCVNHSSLEYLAISSAEKHCLGSTGDRMGAIYHDTNTPSGPYLSRQICYFLPCLMLILPGLC